MCPAHEITNLFVVITAQARLYRGYHMWATLCA